MRFRPNTEKVSLGKFPYRVSIPLNLYTKKKKEILSYLNKSCGLGIVKHKTIISDLMDIKCFKRDLNDDDARWFAKLSSKRTFKIYFKDARDKLLFTLYWH